VACSHTDAAGAPMNTSLAAYERAPGGAWRPASLHVIAIEDGRIAAMTAFIDGTLFAPFGLPATPA
jgi:hypothetical protein